MSIWGKRIDAFFTPGHRTAHQVAQTSYPREPITPERRAAVMQVVTVDAARFGTLTPLGPYQLLLVRPRERVNHILHLLLSLFTIGLWVLVWILVSLDARPEERHVISVDETGLVWVDNEFRQHGLGLS